MANERILIADDEPDVRALARYALEAEGYDVSTVSDGLEAVERARTESFTLLLTDLKMPRMGGLDAFRTIRAFDPDIIGVVMTGYGTMKMAIESLKLGFNDFVIKPFSPTELAQSVSRSLAQARLRQENARLKALMPLFEVSRSFMADHDLGTLLTQIATTAVAETKAVAGVLLGYDSDEGYLYLKASEGLSPPPHDLFVPIRDLHSDPVLSSRTATVWQAQDGSRPQICADIFPTGLALGHLLCHPIWGKNQFSGLLTLAKEPAQTPFSTGDVEFTAVLAGQAAAAIENTSLFARIEEAYEELAKIDHLKSEFINIVAHELRTPLALVLGYTDILEDYLKDTTATEYLNVIAQNAIRLRTIIDDMMNLRYLEEKEATLNLVPVPLREVIETAIMAFAPLAEDKQQELLSDIPPDLAEIRADRQKIELILGNLLSNAIKFTPDRGRIRVTAQGGDPEVTIRVSDTGPGLSLPERERIFDRFYQVEDSLTRGHGGLGLGLSLVRGLVELHGGQVWVESAAGTGSTFCFTIPGRDTR